MSDFFANPWTVAHQAPMSMGSPRQEFWRGLTVPFPEDLPNPGIEAAIPPSHLGNNIYLSVSLVFTHSSVNGHLSCFHFLPVLNNTAMNLRLTVPFKFSAFVFFGEILRSGITGSYGSLIFHFLKNHHTVFNKTEPIENSTNSVRRCPFLHIVTNICYLYSF